MTPPFTAPHLKLSAREHALDKQSDRHGPVVSTQFDMRSPFTADVGGRCEARPAFTSQRALLLDLKIVINSVKVGNAKQLTHGEAE